MYNGEIGATEVVEEGVELVVAEAGVEADGATDDKALATS